MNTPISLSAPESIDHFETLLHRAYEKRMPAFAKQPALIAGDEHLSHEVFNQRANRWAHYLHQAYGVIAGERIGFWVDDSAAPIIAAVAILKAGGVFVPLDPAQPPARLRDIADQTGLRLTLGNRATARPELDRQLIAMDDSALITTMPDHNPHETPVRQASDAAYVLFTSGSTGTPKGVIVPHRAVLRLFHDQDEPRLCAANHLQTASLMFDVSIWEQWAVLLGGGCLVRLNKEDLSAAAVAAVIRRHDVTHAFFTPVMFNALVDERPDLFAPLQQIIIGGEALSAQHTLQIARAQPYTKVLNGYGPTECAIWATCYRIEADHEYNRVPIGKAWSHTHTYVLDADLEPVAPGANGELYLGGAGLAVGYLADPAQSAERFVPNPFDGGRMYRTGDIVSLDADGNMTFLHRRDFQVKVRGYRIELGDIEQQLLQHEAVGQAAVVVQPHQGLNRLVGFYVAETTLREADLQVFLRDRLPAYMIPDTLVQLSHFPTNTNGKLDRKRLPQVKVTETQVLAPLQGERELLVGQLWEELLGDRPGRNHHFFRAGGHSMTLMRLISRLADAGMHLDYAGAALRPELHHMAAAMVPMAAIPATPAPAPIEPLDAATRAQLAAELKSLGWLEEADPDHACVRDARRLHARQRGFVLHPIRFPDSLAYFNRQVYQLRGAVDPGALRAALQTLVNRHANLRSTFAWQQVDEPLQVIHPALPATLDVDDWGASLPVAQHINHMLQQNRQPFDLARGPLVRWHLARRADGTSLLAITFFHGLLDGVSLNQLLTELFALLAGNNNDASTPEQGAVSTVSDAAPAYVPPLATVATTLPMEPSENPKVAIGTVVSIPIAGDKHLFARLKGAARAQGVTVNALIQAAWALFLHRSGHQEYVSFAATQAGRAAGQIGGQAAVDLMIHSLPMTVRCDGERERDQLVRDLHDQQQNMLAHGGMARDQDLAGIQSAVIVRNYGNPCNKFPRVAAVHAYEPTHFPLVLVGDLDDALKIKIDVSLRWYSQAEGEAMAQTYGMLLDAVSGAANHKLRHCAARLRPLPAPVAFEEPRCIHQWFSDVAREHGTATALTFQDQHRDYRTVEAQANRLAHALIEAGVQRGERLALCFERGFDQVIATLAILKAGAAYVPLDPKSPLERLQFIVKDTGVRLLLTRGNNQPMIDDAVTLFDLDDFEENRYPTEAPANRNTPDDIAYLIFTSGSTGQPKGVQVRHRNLTRLMRATEPWFQFNHHDVWTLFHSYAFDFSVWELYGPLLYGGRLVIVDYLTSRNPEAFAQLLSREGVTVLNQTPSAFTNLAAAEMQMEEPNGKLRYLIFGGEALDPTTLKAWSDHRGEAQPYIINMYGITETTVHVTYRVITQADMTQPGISPIGEPIPDLGMLLLDAAQRDVPVGTVGEIHVAGAGLAAGYLNRPELTAERFLEQPIDGVSRLYRTGDLARLLPNGEWHYVGRADNQVKIRGFRIELGEIEVALARHAAVREKRVIAAKQSSGHTRLLAYVTLQPGQTQTEPNEILASAAAFLPDYMVPAQCFVLDHFPLNANGKIDVAKLPTEHPTQETAVANPPQTETERRLADVWCAVLGVKQVSRDAGFFESGGDSIMALQVIAQARKQDLNLKLGVLFQQPSLAELAARVDAETANTAETADVAAENDDLLAVPQAFALLAPADRERLPADVEDAYPLAALQAGMLYHSTRFPTSNLYHNYTTYRLQGPCNPHLWHLAVERLLQNHAVLRSSFNLGDYSQPLQLVHREVPVPFTFVDWQHLDEATQNVKIAAFLETEKHEKFVFERAPLIRFVLHRLRDDLIHMTVTEHHAVLDGWSVYSLVNELLADINQRLRGAVLPQRTWATRFSAYVAAEHRMVTDPEARAFWQAATADAPRFSFPQRGHASVTPANQLAKRRFGRDQVQQLKQLAAAWGMTVKHLLLAVHAVAVRIGTGQQTLLTGMVTNGRCAGEDGDKVLGVFLNTVPMKITVATQGWRELAEQIRRREGEMLPYRRYPLASMHQDNGGPLFEIAFNYTHFHVLTGGGEQLKLQEHGFFDETNFALLAQFNLETENEVLALDLNYDPSRLEARTAERWADTCARVLTHLLAAPNETALQAQHLDPVQTRARIAAVNPNAAANRSGADPTAAISAQAEADPDRNALVFGTQQRSYAELEANSNRIAHHLLALGVQPGDLVAVHLQRGILQIETLIAVLKAGCGYLPLDPGYPTERLETMAADASAALLVSDTAALNRGWATRTIAADQLLQPHFPADRPKVPQDPTLPGYLLYTSGSTGKPKGVLMHRGPLVNLQGWHLADADLALPLRTLQFTSLNFDVHFQEIFTTLATGGSLVLIAEETRRDLQALATLIEQARIERLYMPFVALQQLATIFVDEHRPPRHVRQWITAGEALKATDSLRKLFQLLPDARLSNHYGPTESHVVIAHKLDAKACSWPALPPIGRPIDGATALILDEHLQPVQPGVPGELYLGGAVLARGYRNKPDQTAERFVPDPYNGQGARLYRTGDLAMWDEDGVVWFLGRIDHQVKYRGYRIELGEIEVALKRRAGVSEAVVMLQGESPNQQLTAYVTGKVDDRATVLAELRRELPEYMVPTALVLLERFPLTPSGKINRQTLPAPSASDRPRNANRRAPVTAVERLVAQQFEACLGVSEVGLDDDFFSLGGHSLNATQLAFRLKERGRTAISISDIFNERTVARIAAVIGAATSTKADSGLATGPAQNPVQAPATANQRQLVLFEDINGVGCVYNLPLILELRGPLDVQALQQAFLSVRRRHAGLAARLVRDGETILIHQDAPAPAWQRDQADSVALAQTMADHFVREPLSALDPQPVRLQLIRIDEHHHLFVILMHHVLADGWSCGLLVEQLQAAYADNRQADDRHPAPSFLNHAAALREQTPAPWADDLAYWRSRLTPIPPALGLFCDHDRAGETPTASESLHLRLAQPVLDLLNRRRDELGTTQFILIFSAFAAALARYHRAREFCVGTALANRNDERDLQTFGFFTNLAAIPLNIDHAAPFTELVARVQQEISGAVAHQSLPFEQVLDALAPGGADRGNPFFETLFTYASAMTPYQAGGVTWQTRQVALGHAKAGLTLEALAYDTHLDLHLECRADRIAVSTARTFLDNVGHLLTAWLRDPQQPLNAPTLLVAEQPPAPPLPALDPTPLHQRFERQAAANPGRLALRAERDLTYGELDRAANRMAHWLIARGVQPGDRIAVQQTRRANMVVSLLATLKTGAAYVAVDERGNAERVALIAADADSRMILVDSETEERAHHADAVNVDNLDLSTYPDTRPERTIDPNAVMYLIYTSGTTGTPKAIMVRHRNANRLFDVTCHLDYSADKIWTLFHSIAFDFTVLELWGPLAHGARLVLVPFWTSRNPEALRDLLEREQVTHLCQTPSALRQLLDSFAVDDATRVPHLERVFIGGEALDCHWIAAWRARRKGSNPAFYNVYGPTEAVCIVDAMEITATWQAPAGSILGPVFADIDMQVCDEHMRPLPDGAVGELVIGGACVSKGYLKRPRLTATSFVPDPDGSNGERRYRSGDLALRLADGTFLYLGRRDHQVKVRGFRMELGEIQTALLRLPEVEEALVVTRVVEGSEADLVAYYRPSREDVDENRLRRLLQDKLHPAMWPAYWVAVDPFPLTQNGKIDRGALPEPQATATGRQVLAPRNSWEQGLYELWRELLPGVENIGVDDDFFVLGGQSLRAARLASRIRERFAVRFDVRDLFEATTIATQAERLATLPTTAPRLAPISRREVADRFAVTPGQQIMWTTSQVEDNARAYHLPFAYELNAAPDQVEAALTALVARHESLRTRFVLAEDLTQIVMKHMPVTLSVKDVRTAADPDNAASDDAVTDAARLFDLEQGPLFRFTYYHLSDTRALLVTNFHHLIVDGWSINLIQRDLRDALNGRPLAPPPQVRYRDYAVWLQEQLQGDTLTASRQYWLTQLADCDTRLGLARAQTNTAGKTFGAATLIRRLPAGLLTRLNALAQDHKVTLFHTVWALFHLACYQANGRHDLTVGTPLAGRLSPALEQIVGFFVQMSAVRTRFSGETTLANLLAEIRDSMLAADQHQCYPLEKVFRELNRDPNRAAPAMIEAAVAWQNHADEAAAQDGAVRMQPRDIPIRHAQYDLLLLAMPSGRDHLDLHFLYNADSFSADQISAFYEQLLTLAEAWCLAAQQQQNPTVADLRPNADEPAVVDPFADLAW